MTIQKLQNGSHGLLNFVLEKAWCGKKNQKLKKISKKTPVDAQVERGEVRAGGHRRGDRAARCSRSSRSSIYVLLYVCYVLSGGVAAGKFERASHLRVVERVAAEVEAGERRVLCQQRAERAARLVRADRDLAVGVVVELAERVVGEVEVGEPADDAGELDKVGEVVDAVVREVELEHGTRRLCAHRQHVVRRAACFVVRVSAVSVVWC